MNKYIYSLNPLVEGKIIIEKNETSVSIRAHETS